MKYIVPLFLYFFLIFSMNISISQPSYQDKYHFSGRWMNWKNSPFPPNEGSWSSTSDGFWAPGTFYLPVYIHPNIQSYPKPDTEDQFSLTWEQVIQNSINHVNSNSNIIKLVFAGVLNKHPVNLQRFRTHCFQI